MRTRDRRQLISLSLIVLTLAAFIWQAQSHITYMPVVMRQNTHTPTVTLTPTVTATPRPLLPCPSGPPAPITGFHTSQGKVRGERFETKNGVNCAMPGEDVWFYFEARNLTGEGFYVGGLGALWCTDKPGQCTQASWGDFNWISPHAGVVIGHEDHLNIYTSGTYQVRLAICWLGSRPDCMNAPWAWEYLSDPITIVIR